MLWAAMRDGCRVAFDRQRTGEFFPMDNQTADPTVFVLTALRLLVLVLAMLFRNPAGPPTGRNAGSPADKLPAPNTRLSSRR